MEFVHSPGEKLLLFDRKRPQVRTPLLQLCENILIGHGRINPGGSL
jgi:hypothetical protein